MASGEQPSPSKGKRHGNTNSASRNGPSEPQWMLLPNNLELSARSRPTKKQRNKDKVRSLPPENLSSACNSVQGASSNPLPAQNFPRTKFNTATWLKDQLVNDEKCKRPIFDPAEALSDAEHPSVQRGNLNLPSNQRLQISRSQNTTSRRTVIENENTKSVKDECKKNEADSAIIFERISHLKDFITEASSMWQNLGLTEEPGMSEEITKLKNAMKKIAEEEREHKVLLQQMMESEASGYAAGVSPSSSNSKSSISKGNVSHREVNGTAEFYSEEEQTNKCNHLIEKMKKSEEQLMALKQQESILFQMQRKAENKLAAFRAILDKNDAGSHNSNHEPQNLPIERVLHGVQVTDATLNGNTHWDSETFREPQREWTSENSLNTNTPDHSDFQASSWKDDPQDIRQLHISLEHIKKRVQSIHQLSDNKNVTDPLSSDECDMADVGERAAAVEWERKKLKNKLVELQEKKKKNDELLKELSFLKDAANMVNTLKNSKEEDSNFLPSTSRDSRQQLSKDKRNSKKLDELQATLAHLKGMMNAITCEGNIQDALSSQDAGNVNSQNIGATNSQDNALTTRPSQSAPATKRDNVRKEQNAGFPARRHYEAEGRANEDADVPSAPAPTASPVPEDTAWQDNPRIQEKIRKLQVARDRLKMIQGLMGTIQEAKQNGKQIPLEHLQLLSSLEEEEQEDAMYDEETVTDNEDDKDEDGSSLHNANVSEHVQARNELCEETSQNILFGNVRQNQDDMGPLETEDLENIIRERERLTKLHDQVIRLRQLLPNSEKKNDDRVRSSGEGGNTQRRKPQQPVSMQHALDGHMHSKLRQDNLQLTRQNIATMESQNRNSNTNISTRDSSSIKKDNINNLSGKMGKLSIQNAVNGSVSETSRDNLDSLSTFSTEMNQSFTLRDEVQRKTVLDILNQDRSKQKSYIRNQDTHLGSNSSEDSEPLEGSNSALAPDTTVAATWGGSSTQENFEDENEEQIESLEEQDDEEEEDGADMTGAADAEHVSQVQFPDQFSNFQHYMEVVTNMTDKKKENGRADGFQQAQSNQWASRKNFPNTDRVRPQACRPRAQPEVIMNSSETTSGPSQESSHSPAGAMDAADDYHLRMSAKFILQLREQIDQLNAQCQQRFFQERQPTPVNSHQNPNCAPPVTTNSYRPMSSAPEIMHHYNQQLLLSLSQCYHILFMQQLEIQHLQRCVQQNMDTESIHHSNTASTQASSTEDFTLRPWFLSPWLNTTIPSMPFPTSQVSPLSTSPFLHSSPPSAFSFGQPVILPTNTPACASVPGTQPVRAVVHPAAQEMRSSSETLNNQVPPRTRANNFVDNFRSYSRQNLLSTSSSSKRNENVGLPVAPQIRQVHPLVSNESVLNQKTRDSLYSESSNAATAIPLLSERPLPNPELQELMNRSKKPNSGRLQSVISNRNTAEASRRSLLTNLSNPEDQSARSNRYHAQNIEPTLVQPVSGPSSVNFSQPCQIQPDSKIGSFSSVCTPLLNETTVPPIYSEISNLLAQNENHPDFLLELFHELQNLKSESLRQRALNIVRDLASNERSDSDTSVQNKSKNDHSTTLVKSEIASLESQTDNQSDGAFSCASVEFPASRGTSETSSQWNSQNLPTAAIPPLGKHVATKPVSTGAVKKKLISRTLHTCSFANPVWDVPVAQDNSASSISTSNRPFHDSPANVVGNVLVELIRYLRGQVVLDDSSPVFHANVCSRIIEVLKANISPPLPNRCIVQLRQALEHLLLKYSGLKWCDCEADFLKNVAEFLMKEVSYFKSTGQFTSIEESGEVLGAAAVAASPEIGHQPDVLPSLCKPGSEKRKSTVPSKIKEDAEVTDGSNYFLQQVHACNMISSPSNEPLIDTIQQESEEQINELSIKMPVDENPRFPVQFSGISPQEHARGAVGGESSHLLHSNIQPLRAVTAEEDMGCECDPEAEAEPEVEAGTEADLAEADQSPGQQTTATNSVPIDSWSIEQPVIFPAQSIAAAAAVILSNGEDNDGHAENSSEAGLVVQVCPDVCAEQEISLDDIPTKLSPLSEEELQRQMNDEQSSNSLLMDVVDNIGLSGESDTVREPTNLK